MTSLKKFFYKTVTLALLMTGVCCAATTSAPLNSIPTEIFWKRVHPHLLPEDHPAYAKMQEIFTRSRPIINEKALERAGFEILYRKSRSFIRVVKHPELPGYLLKVYLDDELRKKKNKPGWEWLILRCEGAAKVRKAIKICQSEQFVVAGKWLFVLPSTPAAPQGRKYTPQPMVLVVEDMDLASTEECKHAWKHLITRAHLDELFCILSRAGGSSFRPDNISLRKNGQFAFIDTEYPDQSNNYEQIFPYLSSTNRAYWHHLLETNVKGYN